MRRWLRGIVVALLVLSTVLYLLLPWVVVLHERYSAFVERVAGS